MSDNIKTTIRITTIPGLATMPNEQRDGITTALFDAYSQGRASALGGAGMDEVVAELAALRSAVLSPVQSDVVRDADGRITTIVRTPG